MILYPAIDISGGRAVRLEEGDFKRERAYEQPASAAARFAREGAEWLHVVDLDGARTGAPRNLEHVRAIAAACDLPIQLGGGLRSSESIAQALAAGATRVVLGTAALQSPQLLRSTLATHGPERVAVALDARAGVVLTAGWQQRSGVPVQEAIAAMEEVGVEHLLHTDVARDGLLTGIDQEAVRAVCASARSARIIVSGGVASAADLQLLVALGADGPSGVIVGKALYERRLSVAEALSILAGAGDSQPPAAPRYG
ncbi:MAG TPA: 1-(5-phosphoribosyl)-5-[(5-phosphoribosylamino)methylideneamino]imidazole-4-carboxamide isomerase [Solirubrobacteraceae bacterium]|nr:1-(5-phosphoribosyl)-5-[(5-phosphoribosylamino)methylideneamino]imidazole-4-carboxamide isomerase [Solirubrobacteraceae bacterium]